MVGCNCNLDLLPNKWRKEKKGFARKNLIVICMHFLASNKRLVSFSFNNFDYFGSCCHFWPVCILSFGFEWSFSFSVGCRAIYCTTISRWKGPVSARGHIWRMNAILCIAAFPHASSAFRRSISLLSFRPPRMVLAAPSEMRAWPVRKGPIIRKRRL